MTDNHVAVAVAVAETLDAAALCRLRVYSGELRHQQIHSQIHRQISAPARRTRLSALVEYGYLNADAVS